MAALIILILFIVLAMGQGIGDIFFMYEKLVESPGEKVLENVENKLKKHGILVFKSSDSLFINDFVAWEIKTFTSGDKSYVHIRSGVKTWYFILTVIFLVFFLVIGIVLGILAYWKFANVRDKLKWILAEETGNPTVVNTL